jgi:hydroxyacylglutathione hydrolase
MSLQIQAIPAFTDNYIWAIHDKKNCIVVDPGQAAPVESFLTKHNLDLTDIVITHHHYDHIDGVVELSEQYNCDIYGPEDQRIPFSYTTVNEKDQVKLSSIGIELKIMETPGHTMSHICYYNDQWLFCGDTLFSMGCGRMFEGTAAQFVESLAKIKNLPDETVVYCTHEYTLSNLAFALSLEPQNDDLKRYQESVVELRKQNKPSLPTTLTIEKLLNPFLRTNESQIQAIINKLSEEPINTEVACFASMRKLKDIF